MTTTPTIHLNGTGGEQLLAGYVAALDAVRLAREALAGTAPHMRDYYVAGPQAFAAADEEHVARARRLAEVYGELEAITCVLYEQVEERIARRADFTNSVTG